MSAFAEIAALAKLRSGLALGPEKAYLVEARLATLAARLGVPDYTALFPRLRTDRALQDEVVEALTTNETLFFRDAKPFEHLRSRALPRLHAQRAAGVPLRIWSAAASTGQEAYSLAMLVSELGAGRRGRWVHILGTYIAGATRARAREGRYTAFEVQRGLPARMLARYFTREADGWRLIGPIRGMAEFREWNLLCDPSPLGRFDVIFCRNVLIYFEAPTKARVLRGLASCLAPGGLLYLGAAETITGLGTAFRPLPGEHAVFEASRVPEEVGARACATAARC